MSSIPEADQTHIDLRLLDYVSEIDRNLLCPICHCPFIKPVRLPCDHSFCRQCLEKTFQAQTQDTKTCPTCRVPTEESNTASVPRFLIHLIDDLSVHCPNRSAGCTAQLRRGDVQSHVDHYCEYAETACPDKECKLRVRKTHGRTECPHTAMSCEKCDMQVMEDVMQKHLEEHCRGILVQCEGCHDQIPRNEMVDHVEICPDVEINCAAKTIGCKYQSTRTKVLNHETECVLAAFLPAWKAIGQTVKNQTTTIQGLQRRNFDLETGIAALQSLLGDITDPASTSRTQPSATVSTAIREASSTMSSLDMPPFDSATHHLLSLHESLREEVDRLSGAVSALDAKSSMMIMNESLRIKEDLAHTNAVIGSMRMQLQWLTSARLQALRSPVGHAISSSTDSASQPGRAPLGAMPGPVRRLSDSAKQDLKL